jgi:hypothetical protein
MAELVPNPLTQMQEAVERSRKLAVELAELQDRIAMLSKQVTENAARSDKKPSDIKKP